MRIKILFLLMIIFGPVITIAQLPEDKQWLIRDGKGKNGVIGNYNNYIGNGPITEYKITGIASPILSPDNPSNEYFTIFNDGTFSINNYPSENPIFKSTKPILYQYLTNKYEGDDIPSGITISNHPTTGVTVSSLNIPQSGNITNHDILQGKDITFIIPNQTVSCKLCYNSADLSFEKSGFKMTNNGNSNSIDNVLLFNSSGNPLYSALEFNNIQNKKCVDITTGTIGNVYLNFRPNYPSGLAGSYISFFLEYQNSGNIKELGRIQVSDQFHDPNYVELKCVWKDNKTNKKYARYHVECFNDGSGGVDGVSMTLTLPDYAIASSVQINKWKCGANAGCGTSAKMTKSILGNQLNVTLLPTSPVDLIGLNNGARPTALHIAWFEFCVELQDNTNIYTDNLQPSNPFTTFSNKFSSVNYSIDTYIDALSCVSNDSLPPTVEQQGLKCTFIRKNTKPCGACTCNCRNWLSNIFDRKRP